MTSHGGGNQRGVLLHDCASLGVYRSWLESGSGAQAGRLGEGGASPCEAEECSSNSSRAEESTEAAEAGAAGGGGDGSGQGAAAVCVDWAGGLPAAAAAGIMAACGDAELGAWMAACATLRRCGRLDGAVRLRRREGLARGSSAGARKKDKKKRQGKVKSRIVRGACS